MMRDGRRGWLKTAHGCCQTLCVKPQLPPARQQRDVSQHRTVADSATPARARESKPERAPESRVDGRHPELVRVFRDAL